ncbi:MAG: hypothetical protein H5U13_02435 [Parvibaculum sp.]|nr:hypothetical protein [Parvibaculum sp.]
MSNSKGRSYAIRARIKDVERFAREFSPEIARDAAIAVEAMRRMQMATGPGHVPLDVVSSILTDPYRKNWAKKLLGKAA